MTGTPEPNSTPGSLISDPGSRRPQRRNPAGATTPATERPGDSFARGKTATLRALTLADLADDCPVCQETRARIEAGDPPVCWVYD